MRPADVSAQPPATLRVRRAGLDDADDVSRLGARLFRQGYGPTHPEPAMSEYVARAFAPAHVRAILADTEQTILLIEAPPDEGIAYAQLRAGAPHGPATQLTQPLPGDAPMEIVRFYVDAAWHGRGVAQSLMAACDAVARERGCDVLWLQAWQRADRPLAFYRKAGFAVHGTTVFPFGDRIDEDFILARPVTR